MAQQSKLLGRNGVKRIVRVHTCWCQSSQSFGRVCLCIRHECTECQACEGSLAWMLDWNNAYLYTVHTDLFNQKGSAQSTALQVALLAKQALNVKLVKAHWHECSIETMPTYRHPQRQWSLQCCPQQFITAPRRLTVVVLFSGKFSQLTVCKASTVSVLLVSAAPALNARMMRQAKKRIGAMEIADTPELKSVPQWFCSCWEMTQNSKLNLKELISVAFQLRMSKMLKLKQIPSSSSPRTCGFKPPTDMFPTAERPDNRMQKRLMTKPRRGRAKEHGAIPANDPVKHKFVGRNKWRAKQNHETKEHIKSTISWLHHGFLKTLNL